jgi:hypothetical protein
MPAAIQRALRVAASQKLCAARAQIDLPADTNSPRPGRTAEDRARSACGTWRAVFRVGVAGNLQSPRATLGSFLCKVIPPGTQQPNHSTDHEYSDHPPEHDARHPVHFLRRFG